MPALEKIISSIRYRLPRPIIKRFLGYAISLQAVFRLRCKVNPGNYRRTQGLVNVPMSQLIRHRFSGAEITTIPLHHGQRVEGFAEDGRALGLEPVLQHSGIDAAEVHVIFDVALK